eukprot:CAMPEP_0119514668 /NCGR_PEP_ID=MMETSP1344-20130328/32424_1 /TAXON_ID=236787 /ORGANISM="Florenciella parvula, Strain CCMP2471" /LENGTH=57 /DNA_ID=CAMNT_0007552007 /DNA_START=137 /DNA_END=307 /DNA_ORIENTATION=+
MAISAVIVPSAGRPLRQKHSRSSQLRANGSVHPARSSTWAKLVVIWVAVNGPPGTVA